MSDYRITIKQNNKNICTVGGNNMGYDNVLWWQLDLLVYIAQLGFESKEDLVNKIESKCEYFKEEEIDENTPVLDLDNGTIDKPYFPLFKPEEVNQETCCINLKVVDSKYYSVYEDGSEYPMEYVEFKNVKLLQNKTLTFRQFHKVCNFVNGLIDKYDDTDFVLNNKWIVRFNFA